MHLTNNVGGALASMVKRKERSRRKRGGNYVCAVHMSFMLMSSSSSK